MTARKGVGVWVDDTYERHVHVPLLGVALGPLLDGVVVVQKVPCVTSTFRLHAPSCPVDRLGDPLALGVVVLLVTIMTMTMVMSIPIGDATGLNATFTIAVGRNNGRGAGW